MSKELDELVAKVTDGWIEQWLLKRLGKGNRFNRQFCKDLIADATPIIRKAEGDKVLDAVTDELWKIRQMFDYNGHPTDNEKECTLSNLSITSQRWSEFCQTLKEKDNG